MEKEIKLKDLFGEEFVTEAKRELPKMSEVMQYHVISYIIDELAFFIFRQRNALAVPDSVRHSKDIVARELGGVCPLIKTLCEGNYRAYRIDSGKIYPLE